jgi:diaminopimelate decarboxylase
LESLAHALGTPLYAYSSGRVSRNLARLQDAFKKVGLEHRIYYAMKSNRFAPLLCHIRQLGGIGIDACSPREVALARSVGFAESEISFTGTAVSDRDLETIARFPGVHVNCDSVSSVRRLGSMSPGRSIGLRINPGVGVGYRDNPLVRYSGSRPTKVGIYEGSLDEALEEARKHALDVRGIHVHAGCGYLTPQLEDWGRVLDSVVALLARLDEPRFVNVGGGLGIPLIEDDEPLDLDLWASVLAEKLEKTGVEIWIEPGDFIVKDAGVLVLEVNTVEDRLGDRFVGVDGGFNIHIEPAFYGLPLEVVPVRESGSTELWNANVVGNINETHDVFAADVRLPEIREGQFLAFLNAGGYGSSMSSDHCMRGEFIEALVPSGGDGT